MVSYAMSHVERVMVARKLPFFYRHRFALNANCGVLLTSGRIFAIYVAKQILIYYILSNRLGLILKMWCFFASKAENCLME